MLAETASGAKLTHEQVRRLSAEFNNVGIAARQAGRVISKAFIMLTNPFVAVSTSIPGEMLENIERNRSLYE